jgi:heme exporter protein A
LAKENGDTLRILGHSDSLPHASTPTVYSMQAAQPERAIEAHGLGKRFGIRWVLRGVTLGVWRREAVGLLGPNGSGKSTVLRILGTLLRPNAGTAIVNGLDVVSDAGSVRGQVGYLAHTLGLYDDLTARENLRFAADMLGLPHTSVDENLERVGLAEAAGARVRGFSAGMQRRLALARLIMRRPTVLLLDEPYANLDEQGVELMNSMIGEVISSGGAALLALHELAPARGILDRTLTLEEGRIADQRSDRAPRDNAVLIPL